MADPKPLAGFADDICTAWHRYIDVLVPLPPALYGYCHRLTRNIWDAEDLVQETLLRAFGRWRCHHLPRDSRLMRLPALYCHQRLDRYAAAARCRGARSHGGPRRYRSTNRSCADIERPARDRLPTLATALAPRARGRVLKELFDMTLEEIANLLPTTTGAVKAALHSGRNSPAWARKQRGARDFGGSSTCSIWFR
jgi:RNA polymerase sigma-70 factor, ECF subfamily